MLVTPLINTDAVFCGKTTISLTQKHAFSPNQTYYVETNIETAPVMDVDDDTALSMYVTRAPMITSRSKMGETKQVNVSSRTGHCSIVPAAQAPLTQDWTKTFKLTFGNERCSRLDTMAPGCGGHPILETGRTLNQCDLDSRLWSATIPGMKQGMNFCHIEIGSKYDQVSGIHERVISRTASGRTRGYNPEAPTEYFTAFR